MSCGRKELTSVLEAPEFGQAGSAIAVLGLADK
jgi:hypothetical protein